MRRAAVLGSVTAWFVLWTLSTWALEGRVHTFLRPDAVGDRATYALVANVLIGTMGSLAVLAIVTGRAKDALERAGLGARVPSAWKIAAATGAGIGAYALAGAPTWDPIVLGNSFAQVWAVSVAEILVCWALLGSAFERAASRRGRVLAATLGIVVASAAFGLYHLAHSPPYDTWAMVARLAGVGLVTSIVFVATRDVYATAAFHTWLALRGTLPALVETPGFETLGAPQPALVAMAIAATAALWLGQRSALHTAGRARTESGRVA